jgi:hypothetical protein
MWWLLYYMLISFSSSLLHFTYKKMEVFVRDYKGRRFTLKCESDDTIGILLHQYSALSVESIDGNVYKFVVEGMGSEEVEENKLLSDLGICHESSLRIGLQKRLVEFKVIDFDALMFGRRHDEFGSDVHVHRRHDEDGWRRHYDHYLNLIKKYGVDAEKTYWGDPETKELFMNHRIHLRLPMRIYPFLLSEEVNNGWEIVDIHYESHAYPKIIFKRVM